MEFNWRSPLFTRIAILLSTVFAFAFVVHDKSIFNLLPFGLLAAIAFQVAQLIKSVEQPTGDFSSFFKSMRFDETTFSYKTDSQDSNTKKLQSELNEALAKLKNLRVERDSEYQFFKNIVQHVGIGILTFKKDGSIQIINSAAKRLLRVTKAETLQDLKEISEPLVDAFRQLKTGGRELIRIKTGDESVQLSIFAIELTLRGDELKLISMSNIQNELEEKEMEAWQNLVRVLTHEIMNSVTPISSLAGIVEEDLKHRLEREPDHSVIKKEDLEDMHLSLLTITKRSEGLIHFVREFRNLTHIPKPKITPIEVKRLLEELATLHKKELADAQVTISINIDPADLIIQADKSMIEQVLINLIKNAIQSFDEQV
jgi:nitrogen fixation/metabolism regulation signal transduction histidine kinase